MQEQNLVLVLDVAPVSNFVAEFISCAYGLSTARGSSLLSLQALYDWDGKMGSSTSHQYYLQICITDISFHWLQETKHYFKQYQFFLVGH